MPNSPASPLPLLGVTAAELHHAARRWFGDAKGAGVAPLVHRMAVREARFDPAALGVGPRACDVWRDQSHLSVPEVVDDKREETGNGAVLKRALRLEDGRVRAVWAACRDETTLVTVIDVDTDHPCGPC